MISVDGLTRTYGNFTAVDHMSFTIEKGEIVGLLGHNGAGKTTIMKMLTGYLEPSGGNITIDGIDPAKDPLAVRRKIGYLPENCPVYPEMSVIGYLDYAAKLHGISESKRPERLREAIAQTALHDKALRPVSTLSRGYLQRVGVAQAILHKPSILILDEPTNGLDPTQIQQMRTLIRNLAGQATVIISTHILQEVQAVCSRVMIIRNGTLALDTDLDELTARGNLILGTNGEEKRIQDQLRVMECISALSLVDDSEGERRYRLTLTPESDSRACATEIARIVQEGGNTLFELAPEQRSLETVFGEISADQGRIAA